MKKLTAIILICMLIMVGCEDGDSTGNKALDGDLEVESNQSLVIAQVTAIYGNEITLALAEKVDDSTANENTKQTSEETSQTSEETLQSSATENAGATRSTKDASSSSTESVAASSDTTNTSDTSTSTQASAASDTPSNRGTSSGGAMPSGGEAPSGNAMPTNEATSDAGSMPTDKDENAESSSSDSESSDKAQSQMQVTRYTLTGEEMSATIPVGTPVTTLLGTVTTFSRIAVENTLQIVTEKNSEGEDVIVAIYIVG